MICIENDLLVRQIHHSHRHWLTALALKHQLLTNLGLNIWRNLADGHLDHHIISALAIGFNSRYVYSLLITYDHAIDSGVKTFDHISVSKCKAKRLTGHRTVKHSSIFKLPSIMDFDGISFFSFHEFYN